MGGATLGTWALWFTGVLLPSPLVAASGPEPAPPPAFCADGLASLPRPAAGATASLIWAAAPLLSTQYGKIPGDTLHAFHDAVVINVSNSDAAPSLYTLEYDATAGMGAAEVPRISGDGALRWDNAAAYCLTAGVLHGRPHWSQRYATVSSVPAATLAASMPGFFAAHNGSRAYQTFRVVSQDDAVLLRDETCGDGARRFVAHVSSLPETSTLPAALDLPTSHFTLHARATTLPPPLDVSDPFVYDELVHYYATVRNATSIAGLAELLRASAKYIHDPNSPSPTRPQPHTPAVPAPAAPPPPPAPPGAFYELSLRPPFASVRYNVDHDWANGALPITALCASADEPGHVDLLCPAGRRITAVARAWFGREADDPHDADNACAFKRPVLDLCHTDVEPAVARLCVGRQRCLLNASAASLGVRDLLCPLVPHKRLQVQAVCGL